MSSYKVRVWIQRTLWLFGLTLHNNKDDECCPDFSCCNSELKRPFKYRCKYYKDELKRTLLGVHSPSKEWMDIYKDICKRIHK